MKKFPRLRFLLINLGRGLIWFSLVVAAYLLFMELVYKNNPEVWLERLYAKPVQIYLIYFASRSEERRVGKECRYRGGADN